MSSRLRDTQPMGHPVSVEQAPTVNRYYGTPLVHFILIIIFAIAGILVGFESGGAVPGMVMYAVGWNLVYAGVWGMHHMFTSNSHTSIWPIVKIVRQPPPEKRNWDGSRGGPDYDGMFMHDLITLTFALGAIGIGVFLFTLPFLN